MSTDAVVKPDEHPPAPASAGSNNSSGSKEGGEKAEGSRHSSGNNVKEGSGPPSPLAAKGGAQESEGKGSGLSLLKDVVLGGSGNGNNPSRRPSQEPRLLTSPQADTVSVSRSSIASVREGSVCSAVRAGTSPELDDDDGGSLQTPTHQAQAAAAAAANGKSSNSNDQNASSPPPLAPNAAINKSSDSGHGREEESVKQAPKNSSSTRPYASPLNRSGRNAQNEADEPLVSILAPDESTPSKPSRERRRSSNKHARRRSSNKHGVNESSTYLLDQTVGDLNVSREVSDSDLDSSTDDEAGSMSLLQRKQTQNSSSSPKSLGNQSLSVRPKSKKWDQPSDEDDDDEDKEGKTFVARLNEDLEPILARYKCNSPDDLIKLLKLYSKSVNNLRRRTSSLKGGGEEGTFQEQQYFSFRQYASWKLALSHEREEKMKDIEMARIEENEESIFSELPLERDDHAETMLDEQQRVSYITEDQKKEQRIIEKFIKIETLYQALIVLVQLVAFHYIIYRCTFEEVVDGTGYALQTVFLDIPLMLFAVQNVFAVREERGIYRVRIKEGASKHIRTYHFWLDLIGFFPMEIFGFASGAKCTVFKNSCGFIAPYWQLNKLFLCRTAVDLAGELIDQVMFSLSIAPSMGRIMLVVLQFLLISHVACGICMLLILRDPTLAASWLQSYLFWELDTSGQYFHTMDWSTKTIVGFAKGEPFNVPDECLIVTFIVSCFGILIYATLISSVNNYVSRPSDFNITRKKIDEAMDEMRRRDLPEELVKEVVGFYWHSFETSGFLGKPSEMLQNLPKKLQIDLMYDMGRQRVEKVPLLANQATNKKFVMCLSIALIPETLLPRTILFRKGDKADSMAFVIYGSCGVVPLDYYETGQVLFVLKPGTFFGEIALIAGGRRTATIATLGSWVNLLWLRRANFLQLAEDFPDAVHEMEKKAQERLDELKNSAERERQLRLDALAEATHKVRLYNFMYHWQDWVDWKLSRGAYSVEFGNQNSFQYGSLDVSGGIDGSGQASTSFGAGNMESSQAAVGGRRDSRRGSKSPPSLASSKPTGEKPKAVTKAIGKFMGLKSRKKSLVGNTELAGSLAVESLSGSQDMNGTSSTAVQVLDQSALSRISDQESPQMQHFGSMVNMGAGGSTRDRETRVWSPAAKRKSSNVSALYRQNHPGAVMDSDDEDDVELTRNLSSKSSGKQ